jgi:DNA-directed RNA polymerase subunit RPC12/RpoP
MVSSYQPRLLRLNLSRPGVIVGRSCAAFLCGYLTFDSDSGRSMMRTPYEDRSSCIVSAAHCPNRSGCGPVLSGEYDAHYRNLASSDPVAARRPHTTLIMIKFNCESCGTELEIADTEAEQRGTCPNCRKVITAPAALTNAPQVEPIEATQALENIIRAKCPECEGPIEFPPQLAGQGISCPHCGKNILLARPALALRNGVPTIESPAVHPEAQSAGLFVTKWQKVLTIVALLFFLLTITSAQWRTTTTNTTNALGTGEILHYEYTSIRSSPIWSDPSSMNDHSVLLLAPLLLEWCAIGVFYTAGFFLLKPRRKP